jgi:hypothetical protein
MFSQKTLAVSGLLLLLWYAMAEIDKQYSVIN